MSYEAYDTKWVEKVPDDEDSTAISKFQASISISM